MKINIFSVDLKLVHADDPARRAFRVLEFNDGLCSGFTGYDALGGEKMISGRVQADYRALFPDYRIVTFGALARPQPGHKVIVMPRTDALTTNYQRHGIITAQHLQDLYIASNTDLHLRMLTGNKAYQSYMAAQIDPDAASPLFPSTVTLPSAWKEAADDFSKIGPCDDGYVLKPLTLLGGTGVRLIAPHRLEKDVSGYLSYKRYHGAGNWIGMRDPSCIVQHRVPACEVETGNGVYDGTMRVAFTIYGEEEQDLQCRIHDAYWKLPELTMNETSGSKGVISFSPSNLEIEGNFLSRLFAGVSEQKNIKSAPVDADIKSWLFPQLSARFADYFTKVSKTDYLENTCALLQSDSKGLRGLGLMMAADTEFYPSVSNDAVDAHYPAKLLEALISSEIVRDRNGFLAQHLQRVIENASKMMYCEDAEAGFAQPLKRATRPDILESVLYTMARFTHRL